MDILAAIGVVGGGIVVGIGYAVKNKIFNKEDHGKECLKKFESYEHRFEAIEKKMDHQEEKVESKFDAITRRLDNILTLLIEKKG